jgi:hypothetical protein
MKYSHLFLLFAIGFTPVLPVRTFAQNSPYSSPKGNVGSWSWGTSQPKQGEKEEETETETKERALGETSWERLQSERQPEETAPPQAEILESFSPHRLWSWWRGEKSTTGENTPEATETPESENSDSESSPKPKVE